MIENLIIVAIGGITVLVIFGIFELLAKIFDWK